MSVEKYTLKKDETGFTMLTNQVLQGLTDIEALGLWVYLSSMPQNWSFSKYQLRDHFKIGRDKLDKNLAALSSHGLISIKSNRSESGRFGQMILHVHSGLSFAARQKPSEINGSSEICTPCTEKPLTVNQLPVNGTNKDIYINKQNTNKQINKKNICATDVAQELQQKFDQFWFHYPVRKNKARAFRIWMKGGEKMAATLERIVDDIRDRLAMDVQWQDKQYIPHPSTYLTNRLWEDEIVSQTKKQCGTSASGAFSQFVTHSTIGGTYDQHGNAADLLGDL